LRNGVIYPILKLGKRVNIGIWYGWSMAVVMVVVVVVVVVVILVEVVEVLLGMEVMMEVS